MQQFTFDIYLWDQPLGIANPIQGDGMMRNLNGFLYICLDGVKLHYKNRLVKLNAAGQFENPYYVSGDCEASIVLESVGKQPPGDEKGIIQFYIQNMQDHSFHWEEFSCTDNNRLFRTNLFKLSKNHNGYRFGITTSIYNTSIKISSLGVRITQKRKRKYYDQIPRNLIHIPVPSTLETPNGKQWIFLGYALETKGGEIAILLNKNDQKLKKKLVAKLRKWKIIQNNNENCPITSVIDPQPIVTPLANELIEDLYTKCCTQSIRGIPLIQFLNYLVFETHVGIEVYIVGGAVRDFLRHYKKEKKNLKKLFSKVKDIDLVVSGVSYFQLVQIIKDFFADRGIILADSAIRCDGTHRHFGMIKILKDIQLDQDDLDIGIMKAVDLRTLGAYSKNISKCYYSFGSTIGRDALCRDYGFNAIYVDVCHKKVLDPTNSLADPFFISSVPLALSPLEAEKIIANDIGGQIRFLKELVNAVKQSPKDYEVLPDAKTKEQIIRHLSIIQFNGKDEFWVNKLVKKLYGEKISLSPKKSILRVLTPSQEITIQSQLEEIKFSELDMKTFQLYFITQEISKEIWNNFSTIALAILEQDESIVTIDLNFRESKYSRIYCVMNSILKIDKIMKKNNRIISITYRPKKLLPYNSESQGHNFNNNNNNNNNNNDTLAEEEINVINNAPNIIEDPHWPQCNIIDETLATNLHDQINRENHNNF